MEEHEKKGIVKVKKEHGKVIKALASFCEGTCPICTRAREKGEGFLYNVVKIERHVCPMCRSRGKVHGVPSHKKLK